MDTSSQLERTPEERNLMIFINWLFPQQQSVLCARLQASSFVHKQKKKHPEPTPGVVRTENFQPLQCFRQDSLTPEKGPK